MLENILGPALILFFGFGSFALGHLLPFGLAYLSLRKLVGRQRAFISVCLGTIFVWAAVFVTQRIYGTFGNFTAPNVYGISGAPLIAFLYPVPPMGSDYAPVAMWLRFLFDYVFWIAVAAGMSKRIAAFAFEKKGYGHPLVFALLLAAFGFMAAGFLHILIAFD